GADGDRRELDSGHANPAPVPSAHPPALSHTLPVDEGSESTVIDEHELISAAHERAVPPGHACKSLRQHDRRCRARRATHDDGLVPEHVRAPLEENVRCRRVARAELSQALASYLLRERCLLLQGYATQETHRFVLSATGKLRER